MGRTYSRRQTLSDSSLQGRTNDVLRHFHENGVMTSTKEERSLPEQLNFRCSIYGVEAEDVEVEVDGDRVVISGEAGGDGQLDNHKRPKRDSYFIRTIYLPEGSNPAAGRALVNRDVLEISLDIDNEQDSNGRLFLKPKKIS